ncbi:hypothetical protein JCM10207_003903 [Rhodosporidiobolus poonsookiae]
MPTVQKTSLHHSVDATLDIIQALDRGARERYVANEFINRSPLFDEAFPTDLYAVQEQQSSYAYTERALLDNRTVELQLAKAPQDISAAAVHLLEHLGATTHNFQDLFRFDADLEVRRSSITELFLLFLLRADGQALQGRQRGRWDQLHLHGCEATCQQMVAKAPHLSELASQAFADVHIALYVDVLLGEEAEDESPFAAWLEPRVGGFLALLRHWFHPAVADHTVKRKRSRLPASSSRHLTAHSLAFNPYAPRARRTFASF